MFERVYISLAYFVDCSSVCSDCIFIASLFTKCAKMMEGPGDRKSIEYETLFIVGYATVSVYQSYCTFSRIIVLYKSL